MTPIKKIQIGKLLPVDQHTPYTAQVQAGFRAMSVGKATEGQQVAAFDWLVKEAAGLGTQSFRSDPCETAFAEGRRFVAIQIINMIKNEVKNGDEP